MPLVIVPTVFRGPTQGASEVRVEGATVGECIAAVDAIHPGFAPQCVDGAGLQHTFIKITLNGEILDAKTSVSVEVQPDDTVEVVAAVAGG